MYRIKGEDDAVDFFYVDPFTGRVTLKQSLYPGAKTDYTVSITYKNDEVQKFKVGQF